VKKLHIKIQLKILEIFFQKILLPGKCQKREDKKTQLIAVRKQNAKQLY